MSNIQIQLLSDNSQFLQGMQQADNAQKALAKGAKEVGEVSKKSYSDAEKGAKGYGGETEKTVEKTKSLKAQLRELKAELANATDPKDIERLARAAGALEDQIGDAADAAAVFASDSPFEQIGNSIGSVASKLRNLDFKGAAQQSQLLVSATKSLTFKEALGGIKDLGATLVNVGKSLLLNPIFLIGAVAALIITNFDKLKNAGGFVGETFKSIGKAIDVVLDLGKDFLDFIGLIDSTKKSLDDLVKSNEAVMSNINARYDLEIAKAKAAGKNIELLEMSKARVALLGQKYILNATRQAYLQGEFDAKAYAEKLLKIGLDTNKAAVDLENLKAAQAQKAKDKSQEADEKYKQNKEAFNAALLDLFKKAQAAELEGLSGQAKIDRQKQIAEAELKQLQDSIIEKQKAAGKGNKLSEKQLAEFHQLQLAIDRKYGQDTVALELQTIQEKSALRIKEATNLKSSIAEKQKIFDLETQIQIEQINALRTPKGVKEEDFEKEKQIAILNIKKKAAEDSLNLRLAQVDAETNVLIQQAQAEIALLNAKGDANSLAEAKRLEQTIDSIQLNGDKQKELIIAQTQNLSTDITKETDKLNKELHAFKINWADIFGVSDEEWNAIQSNTEKTIGEVKKVINSFLDAQDATLEKELEVINEKKKVRDSEISSLESALQSQKDLKDAGYANDYERLQQELADKRAQEAQAMADELAIKKEQERLAKERIMVQQAQQLSSLVTAAAEIYASVATAGPLGILAGTVAIGAMLASFAYAQGQASAAINASDSSFYKGGYTGDGDKYEEAGIVHKGEFVNTKETTKKYRNLLEGLHLNDNARIEVGLRDLLKNTGVSLPDLSGEINAKKFSLKQAEMNAYFNKDNSGIEKRIGSLEGHLIKLVKQGDENTTILPNGDKLIKKGSLTIIIRKK
jgi:hypothetical protein